MNLGEVMQHILVQPLMLSGVALIESPRVPLNTKGQKVCGFHRCQRGGKDLNHVI